MDSIDPRRPAEEPQSDYGTILGIAAMLVTGVVAYFIIFGTREDYMDRCRSILEAMLKTPATLDIVESTLHLDPSPRAHIIYDAQNLYGATVRGSITCTDGDSDWIAKISINGEALSDTDAALWNSRASRSSEKARF